MILRQNFIVHKRDVAWNLPSTKTVMKKWCNILVGRRFAKKRHFVYASVLVGDDHCATSYDVKQGYHFFLSKKAKAKANDHFIAFHRKAIT